MSGVVPLLKHTPSAQEPEVLEAITVQREDLIASLVDCALDLKGGLRHQLLIGPRGMGKTHILSLVVSRVRADALGDNLVIAWLDEDPWSIRTYDKLLAAIAAKVAEEVRDQGLAQRARELRASDGTKWLEGEEALREALGARRLVLLVENLDEVFRRIGDEGQARFRAFVEDWRQLLILATSPQLFEGVRNHASPFYGFFAITHLDELSLDNALELMKRIARLHDDSRLLEYLGTDLARRRLAAVEALAGGHPRIWLLLAGCVSIRSIDELVPLFLEALDELTPYYQDRLRELGDQQQELVVLLAEAGGALSNRDLAERSGIAQNQIATMLRHLADRGYVRRAELPEGLAVGDSRLSFWELREPLMRLCLDVKQARSEPLRMVVEFLRAWYGPRLLDELMSLPPEAKLAAAYVKEAFRMLEEALPSADLFRGSSEEILARAELGLSVSPGRIDLLFARVTTLMQDRRFEEAKSDLEELISSVDGHDEALAVRMIFIRHMLGEVSEPDFLDELAESVVRNPEDLEILRSVAAAYAEAGHYEEALAAASKVAALDSRSGSAMGQVGVLLQQLGRHDEALTTLQRAAEIDPADANIQLALGRSLLTLGRLEDAEATLVEASELAPTDTTIHVARGLASMDLGVMAEAFAKAVEIEPQDASLQGLLASALRFLARLDEAALVARRAIELNPTGSIYRFQLAEITIERDEVDEGFGLLRQALTAWREESRKWLAGTPNLLCEALLMHTEASSDRRELFAELVDGFQAADAAEELGAAIVSTIPDFVSGDIDLGKAERWVDDWLSAPADDELEIPFAMLRAALGWKRDRDRSHLLALPPEQREILIELLEESEE